MSTLDEDDVVLSNTHQRVFFDPPLSLQRQQWLLQRIGEHKHENVMELGCGEGKLVKALCVPQLWADASEEWKMSFKDITGLHDHPFLQGPLTIAPKRIIANDVDAKTLKLLQADVQDLIRAEASADYQQRYGHDLNIEFLLGDFSHLSSQQIGDIDVVVASEVVEHLDESILSNVGSVILGQLQPKCFLVTTPNYSFNTKFGHSAEQNFYNDPTGRTDRFFRHDDHKFEWTTEEFTNWCDALAQSHGYSAHVGGIGVAQYKGRRRSRHMEEPEVPGTKYATQTVVFKRLDVLPCPLPQASIFGIFKSLFDFVQMLFWQRFDRRAQCSYRGTFLSYDKDACDGKTIMWEADQVAYATSGFDPDAQDDEKMFRANVWDLWMNDSIRRMCGGRLETFLPPTRCVFGPVEAAHLPDHEAWRVLDVQNQDVYLLFKDEEIEEGKGSPSASSVK